MRIFILALLLPAYSFAAVHVEPHGLQQFGERDAAMCALAPSACDHDDNSALLSELSDTTDDVCDHCITHRSELTAARVRLWSPPLEAPQVPDPDPRRALRPPSASLR